VSKLNQIDSSDDGQTIFTDADVEPQILQIIRNAESQITFVTPYIELWNHLKDEILEARRRNVQVLFFIRAGGRVKDPTDLPWLRSNISALYEVPMLHAKIYLNEKTVLVSSMNITMGSTRNSMDFAMLAKFAGSGANNTVVLLDATTNIIFTSGVISGGATYYVGINGAVGYLSFHNVTMETESQPVEPTYAYDLIAGYTITVLDDNSTSYITTTGTFSNTVTTSNAVRYSH